MLISTAAPTAPIINGAWGRTFLLLVGLACSAGWPAAGRAEADALRTEQAAAEPASQPADLNAEASPAHSATGTVGENRAAARAEFWGELPDLDSSPAAPSLLARGSVNLLIAANKTGAQRYSDMYTSSGKKRRRSLASLIRSRLADDANFRNRTRFLARRIGETGRSSAPALVFAQTGAQFLDALVDASQRGPIANLVIYGHAASAALFMREDRGFYASVMDVAKSSHVVSGEDIEKDEQLRLVGARDMSDFERLLARGEIRFTRNPVIVFAGCGVAGKRDIEPASIAARMAELTGAKVIASIDVTDQSMARGRDFRDYEYSRRSWVRFSGGEPPVRLNTKVIDALAQLNFEGEAMASGPRPDSVSQRASN